MGTQHPRTTSAFQSPCDLTDQDFKDLGRQLLLAVAELGDVRKGAAQPPSAVTEPAIAQHDAAERIAEQTLRDGDNADALELLEGRFQSLSKAHSILSESNWRGGLLKELVER
jgi:hypothetical protein